MKINKSRLLNERFLSLSIGAALKSHDDPSNKHEMKRVPNVLHFMEKDPGGYTLLHNDLEIYVYTNSGDYRASWFADDIVFTISFYPGSPDSITEQEFLMIVESIPK